MDGERTNLGVAELVALKVEVALSSQRVDEKTEATTNDSKSPQGEDGRQGECMLTG